MAAVSGCGCTQHETLISDAIRKAGSGCMVVVHPVDARHRRYEQLAADYDAEYVESACVPRGVVFVVNREAIGELP